MGALQSIATKTFLELIIICNTYFKLVMIPRHCSEQVELKI